MDQPSLPQTELRRIISRAALAYLVLFIGVGLGLSLLGANPLAKNGLMPKALLIFVGLAVIIALANRLAGSWLEPGQNWLNLMRGVIQTITGPNKKRGEDWKLK